MHRWDFQESLKAGLLPAVSTRALNRVRRLFGAMKPHCIGNTLLTPDELGAMTGTISVGRTSPDVISGLQCVSTNLAVSAERKTVSNISFSS